MKNQHARGGKFLATWNGEAPKGRESSPLCYQKGQREEDRRLRYSFDSEGARIWSF